MLTKNWRKIEGGSTEATPQELQQKLTAQE